MPNILVIDDDEELFTLLDEYLKDEGFSCVHAPDAEKGLRKAAGGDFDAVVLDVMLPGRSGFEVLRLLREDEGSGALPVIMLTARGEEIDRVVGLEMGADDYLGKPFSPRELVARLRAVMRRSARNKAAPRSELSLRMDDLSLNPASMYVALVALIIEM
ncbi:MAG: response regulator transcription factor [Deltaproteobacteria bacterium]|jgi:DNA-binding response OmpR family regulator|nr:response regulator transcription factor [Deltaproteobacteria bacterium]